MQRPITKKNWIRRLAGIAAVSAILLRSIIPLGYMPGDLLAGEYMVLCPSGASGQAVMQVLGGHHDHDASGINADETCPIGTALQYLAIPTSLAVEIPHPTPELVSTTTSQPMLNDDTQSPFKARAPPAIRS